jgi:hypothetical protein
MLVEHGKRIQQFIAKNRPVRTIKAKRCERTDNVFFALCCAIVRLNAESCERNSSRHAKAVFDIEELGAPFVQACAALGYAARETASLR